MVPPGAATPPATTEAAVVAGGKKQRKIAPQAVSVAVVGFPKQVNSVPRSEACAVA